MYIVLLTYLLSNELMEDKGPFFLQFSKVHSLHWAGHFSSTTVFTCQSFADMICSSWQKKYLFFFAILTGPATTDDAFDSANNDEEALVIRSPITSQLSHAGVSDATIVSRTKLG